MQILCSTGGYIASNQVVELPDSTELEGLQTDMKEMNIPADLAFRLLKLIDNPFAWWMGEIQRFHHNPLPNFKKIIKKITDRVNRTTPIACIHVRRTDKITESSYIPLKSYMNLVNEYYDQLDIKTPNISRIVYIASDEPNVFKEARIFFPNFKYITNDNAAKMVQKPRNRVGKQATASVIADMEILAKCDFSVVTYSSNIGRRAFEKKYTYFFDAYDRIFSLDAPYKIFVQKSNQYKIIMKHTSRKSNVTLKKGDTVLVHRQFKNINLDGIFTVLFKRLRIDIPEYKLEKKFHINKMPVSN